MNGKSAFPDIFLETLLQPYPLHMVLKIRRRETNLKLLLLALVAVVGSAAAYNCYIYNYVDKSMTVGKHIVEHEILGIASVKKGDGFIGFYVDGTLVAKLLSNGDFKITGDFSAGETF